jgi:hypothetical protein
MCSMAKTNQRSRAALGLGEAPGPLAMEVLNFLGKEALSTRCLARI